MEIKNRLFPYPVLCNENDDYKESSFYGKCNLKEELSDIILDFDLTLENNNGSIIMVTSGQPMHNGELNHDDDRSN